MFGLSDGESVLFVVALIGAGGFWLGLIAGGILLCLTDRDDS